MAPPALRRSTPWSPADGSFSGANSSSRLAILRPLTKATAPPRRSATSRNRDFISGSAAVCEGVSVSSTSVPSTSRNKHQSSAGGGGACFMREKHSLRGRRCQWLRYIYFSVSFTRIALLKIRDCASKVLYFVSTTRPQVSTQRRHDVSLDDAAIRPAGRPCLVRGGIFRAPVHRAFAGGVVPLRRRIARAARDAFRGGTDHGSRGVRHRRALAGIPDEVGRRRAIVGHPGVPAQWHHHF